MAAKKFSIDEALGFGWKTMTSNFLQLFGFGLLFCAIVLVPILALKAIAILTRDENNLVLSLFSSPVHLVANAIATMGMIKVMLDYCDDKKPGPQDFFCRAGLFLNYLIGLILYTAIVTVGIFLLIVPGVIWAIQFQFVKYFIVDKEMGPIEALKASSEITQGVKWNLLGFWFLVILINFIGLLFFLIGVIPAGIVTALAVTHIYRQLITNAAAAPVNETI